MDLVQVRGSHLGKIQTKVDAELTLNVHGILSIRYFESKLA